MQNIRQFKEEKGKSGSTEDTIISRDQFIEFVNWLGMSDVVIKEEKQGRYRVQFVDIVSKGSI